MVECVNLTPTDVAAVVTAFATLIGAITGLVVQLSRMRKDFQAHTFAITQLARSNVQYGPPRPPESPSVVP